MIMDGNDTRKLNMSEQVSDESMAMEKDAFFERLREERENRMSRFSQTMDKEDFARFSEALTLFDDEQNVMEREFERRLERYFDTLISLLETAIKKQGDGSGDKLVYCQAVEELYLINCERVRRDNSYRIYKYHPVFMMNRRLDADTKSLLEERKRKVGENEGTISKTDYEMLNSVFEAKIKNRWRMKLYSRNLVYETMAGAADDKVDFICALPFRQSDDNTEIPLIRIWEKITNYLVIHPEKEKFPIRIAVFGRLAGFSRYKGLLEKLVNARIELIAFQHIPTTGEYFFADETGEEVYDLLDMIDLQTLVDSHEIILFLDQNCFYRQGQAEKDVREKSEGTNCRWNFDRSQRRKDFKDKAAFYQVIYNRIGQWVNSIDNTMSASYEFDERIYKNLEAVSKENTDIYLYIRYGSMIGAHNLANNGICNDEYYDGMSLTVCRLTKLDRQQFNADYRVFLEQSDNRDKEFYVSIKFWKLLKSVSNNYCDGVLKRFGGEDEEKLKDIILFLNKSYLTLKYVIDPKEEKVCVQYELKPAGEDFPELRELMGNVTSVILKYAFGNEKLYCMNRYFERLLIHSVISNASDVGDLIFAHWMATHWYKTEKMTEGSFEEDHAASGFSTCINKFKVRKTVYSIVEKLDDMRMRSIPDMRGYFFSSFRGRICPEVTPENMEKTFHLIRDYCERFQHTGGYLYVNSKLIDE